MTTTMNVRLLLVVLLIAAAATVLPLTEAAEHVVGDATGWTVPAAATFYSTWAANKNFSVGDVLVFNFTTGAHDVATVDKDAFDTCNKANTLPINNGPASITLNTTGENYFICTIGQHCTGGQKLAVNVTGTSTTPSPPGVMAPPPPPPPPPSGSSASSLAATFSLILVTIASTIFYLF
ncbi:umecyanin-like [Corylus avellana]|uniref:umecyanin-like n=1 Tax=Corylus avellana TaxID=13451 RepID=UPI00286AAC08|nr:umecyanin-like [Corylus avellana]